MRILHTSDLHGEYKRLLNFNEAFDIWVDTGDFFPTYGRAKTGYIEASQEIRYQRAWCQRKSIGSRIKDWLDGRPMVCVSGNHDYINLARYLSSCEVEAFDASLCKIMIYSLSFYGFGHIPYIAGEWNNEINDFSKLIDQVVDKNPDILLTHAPPLNILDKEHYGISELVTAFAYRNLSPKHHFYGHVHENGGESTEEMQIKFHNGARNLIVHEV